MSRRDLVAALEALIRVIDHADELSAIRRGTVILRARAVARRAAAGLAGPVPWTPFVRAHRPPIRSAQIAVVQAMVPGLQPDDARRIIEEQTHGEQLFVNSRYQVAIAADGDHVHLSIKRLDQAAVHDWRDLQRVKNELVGAECEAIELYPAESRVVDTVNQYHLWCQRDPTFRFPIGFQSGLRKDHAGGGAHQRPPEVTLGDDGEA